MAIVKQTSDLFRDQLTGGAVLDAAKTKGRLYTATGTVTNAATDSNGSMWKLIDLPADCILDERCAFDVQNDGFAQIVIGTKDDPTALVNQTKATENTVTPLAFGDANHGKPLWELLGMAANPGGVITLYKHAVADAAGAGNMPFRISWLA